MTSPSLSRAEVSFQASRDPEGRPVIALVLSRDGKPAADRDFVFYLEPNLAAEDVDVLVGALNRCVTHLGLAGPDDDDPQGGLL